MREVATFTRLAAQVAPNHDGDSHEYSVAFGAQSNRNSQMWLSSYLWSRTFRWRLQCFNSAGVAGSRATNSGDEGLSSAGASDAELPGVGRTLLTALLRQRVRDG